MPVLCVFFKPGEKVFGPEAVFDFFAAAGVAQFAVGADFFAVEVAGGGDEVADFVCDFFKAQAFCDSGSGMVGFKADYSAVVKIFKGVGKLSPGKEE